MKECYGVILLSCAISTVPLQIIGFISPFWSCDESVENGASLAITNSSFNSTNSTCDFKGLFYSCNDEGCQRKDLDKLIFWLCLVSVCITCLTTLSLVYIFYKKLLDVAEIQWTLAKNKESFLYAAFFTAQVLSGLAVIILAKQHGSLGWSAFLFTTLAIPELFLPAILVCSKLCAKKQRTRGIILGYT